LALVAQDQRPPQIKALTVQTLYFPPLHPRAAAAAAVMETKLVMLVALVAAVQTPAQGLRVLLRRVLEAATLT
jgi:hypothetical protein